MSLVRNPYINDPAYSSLNIRFIPALFSSHREDTAIDMLVMHYTAGPSLEDCIAIFRNPERPVSCHYIVGMDGAIVQMVYDHDCAWHCGVSNWQGRERCNPRSLGIEIVNWGKLEKRRNKFYCWCEDYTTPYDGPDPVFAESAWWAPYPQKQKASVIALSQWLVKVHHIPLENIVGHSDIAPGRKIDPGPAFPWREFRDQFDDFESARRLTIGPDKT